MKLYLITSDTSTDLYGVEIDCFGIATTKESANIIKDPVAELGHVPYITEIESDKLTEKYLGGYIE